MNPVRDNQSLVILQTAINQTVVMVRLENITDVLKKHILSLTG